MAVLKLKSPLIAGGAGVKAELQDGYSLHIDSLETWLCRVAIVPESGLDVPNTWMIAPDGDVPWAGQPRLDTSSFSCPGVSVTEHGIRSDFLEVLWLLTFDLNLMQVGILYSMIVRWQRTDTYPNGLCFNMHKAGCLSRCILV